MRERSRAAYDFIAEIYLRFGKDHGSFLAATISYYALFSIFPLLLVLISLAGYIFAKAETAAAVLEYTSRFLPQFSELISVNIEAVTASRSQVGVIAVVGLLWTGTAIFDALEYALDTVWGEAENRLLWRAKLLGVATVVILGAVLALLTLSAPLLEVVRQFGKENALGRAIISGNDAYFWLINMAAMAFVFLLIYHIVPSRRPKIGQVWPGALAAAVIWEIARRFFAWYVRRIARFSAIYGSLGIVIGLLIWLYVLGMIIVLGAEIAVVIDERRRKAKETG